MQLTGAAVNDIVSTFYGPHDGSNYGGSAAAYCNVTLDGIGSSGAAVKVQQNITAILGYDDGNRIMVPDPSGWSDVGTVSAEGLTHVTLTVQSVINWIRVIVSHVGAGTATASGSWHAATGGGGSSGMTVDSTAISGGTSGRLFFHKTGNVLGEFATSISGSNISFPGNLSAINGGTIGWTSRSAMFSTADGQMSLATSALSTGVRLDFGTADTLKVLQLNGSAVSTLQAGTIALGGSTDTYIGRSAAANIRLGLTDAASPVAQTISVQNVLTGTADTAGANLTVKGSIGTGTGLGGSIIFQTAPPAGSTASTPNTLYDTFSVTSTGLLLQNAFPSGGSNYNIEARADMSFYFPTSRQMQFYGCGSFGVYSTGDVTFQAGGGNWTIHQNTLTSPASAAIRLVGGLISALPSGALGMEATVTDGDAGLAWGATVVNSGSGATSYKVWYNGTNWTVVGK